MEAASEKILEKLPLLGSGVFPHVEQYNGDRDGEGYDWDFVIVINDKEAARNGKIPKLVHDLNNVQLETYSYFSVERDMVIVKVRASVSRLSMHAASNSYSMPLDELRLKEAAEQGKKDSKGVYTVKPLIINHVPEITPIKPHEYIYCKFSSAQDETQLPLFAHAEGYQHPFGPVHRLKLIASIIEKDAEVDLDSLQRDGTIAAYFPIKDEVVANELLDAMYGIKVMPWLLPIDKVKNYLGERIGIYFAFIGHYTTFLLPLAAVGLLTFLEVMAQGKLGSGGFLTPVYAILVCVWAQTMIEFWKRKQAMKVMEWGMNDYALDEKDLPAFQGDEMDSVIDGKPTTYFPENEKLLRTLISLGGCVVALVLVILSLFIFYVIRLIFGGFMTYLITAIVIQVMNDIFMATSVFFTEQENHRLESQYEESLIVKLFFFQFINSYAMLFYIAFFRTMIGDDCTGGQGCMGELSLALFVIFGFRLVYINAEESLWPIAEPLVRSALKFLKSKFIQWYDAEFSEEDEQLYGAKGGLPPGTPRTPTPRKRGSIVVDQIEQSLAEENERDAQLAKKKELEKKMSLTEKEFNRNEYTKMMQSIDEYAELSIQFGYVTLFVAAFPLAPLFAFVSNFAKIKVDAYRLLCSLRRPMPSSDDGIGIWLDIFQIISLVAVVTNSGIIAFSMNPIVTDETGVYNTFIAIQYTLFVLMGLSAYLVPDVPSAVPIQLKRQEVLVQKVMHGVPDPEKSSFPAHTKDLYVHNEEDGGGQMVNLGV